MTILGFIFGGVSCMCAAMSTHPIDTIKVRLQIQGELSAETTDRKYNGMIRGIRTIIYEEGIMGLYKGLSSSLLREATYSTVRMGLYEPFKNLLRNDSEKQDYLYKKIVAGGLSGAFGAAFATPTDLIKIRLQAHNGPHTQTAYSAFISIIKEEGFKGLYRGIAPNTIRAVVLTASQLPAYDHSKHWLMEKRKFKEGILTHCFASMMAGLVCATTTSPVDLVKARYMNQKFDVFGKGVYYNSMFDCFKKTVLNEGFKGLYKGWLPNWLRIGPHTIITFVVLEQLRRIAGIPPV